MFDLIVAEHRVVHHHLRAGHGRRRSSGAVAPAPAWDGGPAPLFGAIPAPLVKVRPAPAAGAGGAPPVRPPVIPPGRLFAGVVRGDLPARLARRGAWTALSGVAQAALVIGVVLLSVHLAVTEQPVLVEVKILRAPAARPGPPPPPAPPAARRSPPPAQAARPPPTARKAPPLALVQPHEVPAVLKAPDPAEPIEDWDLDADGSDDGVVGGIPGGATGGVVAAVVERAPPPRAPAPPAMPVKFDDRMTAPALVSAPPLEYTRQALEREVEGTMLVECVVDVDGRVSACRVLTSLPFMDRAVIENLEQRRYRPATLRGEPLAVRYRFTLRFALPR